jgi:acetyl esterase/lipase
MLRAALSFASLALLSNSLGICESGTVTIPLWPDGAPGASATSEPEKDTTTDKDRNVAGRRVIRLSNVMQPAMTIYPAPATRNTGAAVIVFPGGGYRILAYDLEGTEACAWLNSIGLSAALVKYRVPQPAGALRHAAPLQDAQRALRILRSRASEFGIESSRVGVLGFSAGGHVSAVLSNHFSDTTYKSVDAADNESCRPAFTLLIYPAYLSVQDKGEELAPEVQTSSQTPPTFIVQAEDDHPFIAGTLLYYRALTNSKTPAEMHIYSAGGHGYGLRPAADPVTEWPRLAESWLQRQR